MTANLDIAAALAAVVWPLIILIILLVTRKHLPALVQGLAGRVKKLEFAGISLELAEAKLFAPDWSGAPGALDLRSQAASTQISDSTSRTFTAQLLESGHADYAIVNLGTGKEWLTSRLYIMAILFARMKRVRAFVFLETAQGVRKRYVGWAESEKIRWALGRRYRWLEVAYADAYSQVMAGITQTVIVSDRGQLGNPYQPNDPWPSIDLLTRFLRGVQADSPPLPPGSEDWVMVGQPLTYEHAHWLDSAGLEELLGDDLNSSMLRASELKAKEFPQQARAILGLSGPFVALTEDDGRFQKLYERIPALEQSIGQLLQKTGA